MIEKQAGLVFIRNETIDFIKGKQTYFSPFETFIQEAVELGMPMHFVIPVTEKDAQFENLIVRERVEKISSARGLFHGLLRVPAMVNAARRVRRELGYRTVVVRVPEHVTLLLLPLLWLFRFQVIIWLVHDRESVTDADLTQRATLRSYLASLFSRITGRIERLFLARCPVIANGQHLKDNYCAGNMKVRVVYSTLLTKQDFTDLDLAGSQYSYEKDEIRLVYAGRISVEKGIGRIFDLYEQLDTLCKERGMICSLALVGKLDDTMRNYFRERISALADPSRVEFLGFAKRGPELWDTYANKDFFCLLSQAEGTPRVVPEAYAAGIPVVITPEANANDIVDEPSLIWNVDDTEVSAQAIIEFHQKKETFLNHRQALRSVAKDHSIAALLQKFGALAK